MSAIKNILVIGMFAFIAGCSMRPVAAASEFDFNTLQRPLHVYDAKKIFRDLNNGHGPYLWSAIPGTGKEAWLWFIPRENVDVNKYEIAFITEGKSEDPDTQEVVWPNEIKGQSLDQIYKATYKNFLSK